MDEKINVPDMEWSAALSAKRGVAVRCPFATVEACPRYYQSLSLLGQAGSTKIPEEEGRRLQKKWEKSDLWPRTDEQATGLYKFDDKPKVFSRFCPEVMFDRFGYFASGLATYSDEIDVGLAHEQLEKERAARNDPRWSWSSCEAQHYTECSLYAVLQNRKEQEILGQDGSITTQEPAGMTGTFPCPTCRRDTAQAILSIVNRQDWALDGQVHFWHHYLTVKCGGCGTVSFCHESMNSEEMDVNAQGQPVRVKTRKSYPEAPAPEEYFVNPNRLEEIQSLPKGKYDATRLHLMLVELNRCYAAGSYLSCIFLVRAILDHVPPIFGVDTFEMVANNYGGGGKSFKEAMKHLQNSSRKIADGQLHTPIRSVETLPNREQAEFRSPLDLLVSEVVRKLLSDK